MPTDRPQCAFHSSSSEVCSTDDRSPVAASPGSWTGALLQTYFRSGWAFLIPYLAVYLLYAWLRWPVNPVAVGQWTVVPCLLYVYWTLHAINLVFGGLALRAWWRAFGTQVDGATNDREKTANRAASPQPSNVHRPPSRTAATVYRLLPWIFLALLFYIPGTYFEWSADPKTHLMRINRWQGLNLVLDHATWNKSSYFLPYSLTGKAVAYAAAPSGLNFYYTGICLLLCWQYYRLARACDLGERASMMFVLLQALLFGNNIFSFYRYYGISSSILAQLGAVALTRIVLEAAKHPQLSLGSFFGVPCFISQLTVLRQPSAVYRLLLSVLCILPLIRYNHAQGLGIAGLGVGAVIVWRLIEWRRSALWWLIVTTLVINVLFLWLYPRPAMVEILHAQGFLNAWYGFNILNFTSSAGDRMLQIVGVFGLINFAAAFVLIRRNHVIAWLTILPIAAMLLPCIAIPLVQVLVQASGPGNVITFQRFFFSIPPCLAVAYLCAQLQHSRRGVVRPAQIHGPHPSTAPFGPWLRLPVNDSPSRRDGFYALVIVSMVFFALTTAPSSFPFYNRTWNSLVIVPADLQRESSENQTSPSSHAGYLSRHWSPSRNTPITLKTP